MINLIGISGKRQAGKDTTAKFLSWNKSINELRNFRPDSFETDIAIFSTYGINKTYFSNDSFAKPVKECVSIYVLGYIHPDIFSEQIKKDKVAKYAPYSPYADKTFREMFIEFGNDIARGYDKDFWIKSFNSRMSIPNIQSDKIAPINLITDLRYENEADTIKELGGILIRINKTNRDIEWDDVIDNNPSETGLDNYDKWDEIYTNDGSLIDLFEFTDSIYKKYDLYGK